MNLNKSIKCLTNKILNSRTNHQTDDNSKESRKSLNLKEISKLLARRKLEGYLTSKDLNIFPLSKHSKYKYLEAKDFVEISIRYCIMDDDEICNFILFLFYSPDNDFKCVNLFPLTIYKLLIFYEKICLFECLYEKEKILDKIKGSNLITECFSYSIIINSITVALYLLRKYIKELYYKNESIIDSILFILNEYTESNGAVRYHHGISHIEELLYFIEIFMMGFSYGQAFYLIRILLKLSNCSEWEGEELDHYDKLTKQKIIKAYQINRLRTHFIVYSENPLKICVAIIIIVIQIGKHYSSFKIAREHLNQIYINLAREIIIHSPDIDQIRDQLHDTFYNGKMVIDEIATYELYDILHSRKPVVIINEMWSGKYESDFFMKFSLPYRIVQALLVKNNDFVHYYPNFIDEFKGLYYIFKPKSKECMYHLDKKQKAHMFMFKSWKSSMNLRYMIDALSIIVIAVTIQLQLSRFQNQAMSYTDIIDDYNSK